LLIHACISSHGFGHGSRTASVLSQLHRLRPQWRLVLSTALPEAFLATAFGPLPVEHRRCQWDVGMLQADALGSDPAATLQAESDEQIRLLGSPNQVESVTANLQKRAPAFVDPAPGA
jgi:hypothetical protein